MVFENDLPKQECAYIFFVTDKPYLSMLNQDFNILKIHNRIFM